METKYRIIKADDSVCCHRFELPEPKTFQALKESIADAFYKGIRVVRLYSDGRKRNNYLEIRKGDFDKSFIEESYKNIQNKNRVADRLKRIDALKDSISWSKKKIKEIESEIKSFNK